MAADEPDPSTTPVTAAAITQVIARRAKLLREDANLSGAKLAKRLSDLGVPWNRTTVAKFETFKRHSISVQELLALATALGVPPVMLLADPRHVAEVPLAEGKDGDTAVIEPAWDALFWMIGRLSVHDGDAVPASYRGASDLIIDGTRIVGHWSTLRRHTELIDPGDPIDAARAITRDADEHRRALILMRMAMERIEKAGARPPALPKFVVDRASELGIDLPGMEG